MRRSARGHATAPVPARWRNRRRGRLGVYPLTRLTARFFHVLVAVGDQALELGRPAILVADRVHLDAQTLETGPEIKAALKVAQRRVGQRAFRADGLTAELMMLTP